MALAVKGGDRTRAHQIPREQFVEASSNAYKHDHVVILDSLTSRCVVVADDGPYPAMLVRRDGSHDTVRANKDTSLAATAHDSAGDSSCVVRTVDGSGVAGAHIPNLMTVVQQ